MRSLWLYMIAITAQMSGLARAQVPYNDCGTILPGSACFMLFHDTQGQNWLLDDFGGFTFGDQVRVVGTADPTCIVSCMLPCLYVSMITPCTSNPGALFCAGDGSGAACPCGNNSPQGQGSGCLNSLGTGALLSATGVASVASDTVVLSGTGMPNSSALYFRGTSQLSGGNGIVFGDGLRCVGGTIVRLGVKLNAGGASQYPTTGDASVSVRGGVAPGDIRQYQVWYRNAAPFCMGSTFNMSNGIEITWGP
jgi:hypothetical protein